MGPELIEKITSIANSHEVDMVAHNLYVNYSSQSYDSLQEPFPRPSDLGKYEKYLYGIDGLAPYVDFAKEELNSEPRLSGGTTYTHCLRVVKRIDDLISPLNGKRENLFSLSLIHDFASEHRQMGYAKAQELGLIDDRRGFQLQGLSELEILGEGVRLKKGQEDFNPYSPGIVAPEKLQFFIEKYGTEVPFVAAVELVDRLANPIPDYLTNPKSWEAMHNDALEALYLYTPLMEGLDNQPVVAALKTYANLYLDYDMAEVYKDLLTEFTQPAFREAREKDIQNALRHTAKYVHLMEELFGYRFLDPVIYRNQLPTALDTATIENQGQQNYYILDCALRRILSNDRKEFTIPQIRDKSIGSAYMKARKYLSQIFPNWEEVHPTKAQKKSLLRKTMLNLPDLIGFEAIGLPNDKFLDDSERVLRLLHDLDRNIYNDVRNEYLPVDKWQPNLERTERSSGYDAVHAVFKNSEMTRPIEAHIFDVWRYVMQKVGPANHLDYKAGVFDTDLTGVPLGDHTHESVVRLYKAGTNLR